MTTDEATHELVDTQVFLENIEPYLPWGEQEQCRFHVQELDKVIAKLEAENASANVQTVPGDSQRLSDGTLPRMSGRDGRQIDGGDRAAEILGEAERDVEART